MSDDALGWTQPNRQALGLEPIDSGAEPTPPDPPDPEPEPEPEPEPPPEDA